MNNTAKWSGAIALSILAHVGAVYGFGPAKDAPEPALTEGGEAMQISVLGNAQTDAIEAGEPDDPIDPIEDQTETVEPVETETAQAVVEDVAPVDPVLAPETPSDLMPTQADVILPAEEMPPVTAEEPEVTATVAPAETVVPEEKPEQPPEPEKVEKPEPKKPEPTKKPAKEKPPEKKPVKRKAGESGESVATLQRGDARGVEGAKAAGTIGNKGRVAREAGNAAVSKYGDKVRSKLQRAFRYPSEAKREGLRGTASVAFTVSADGSVSGVRVIKSSGHQILDEAAIAAVQRAAPFADIPAGAGKNSWPFTIPLGFGGD